MFRDQSFRASSLSIDLVSRTGYPAGSILGMDRLSVWIAKVAVVEFAVVGASSYLTSALYHAIAVPEWLSSPRYVGASIVIAALYSCASLGFRDFRKLREQRYQSFLLAGLKSVAFALAFFLSALFLLKIAEDYSRGTFLFQIMGISIAVLAVRSLTFVRMQTAIASGRLEGRRALLIGDPGCHTPFSQRLKAFGVRTVGHMPISSFESNRGPSVRQAIACCREFHADDIIIVVTPADLQRVAELVDALSQLPVAIHLVPVGVGEILTSSEMTGIGDVRTMQVLRPPLSTIDISVKRLFDISAALVGLALLSPLLPIVALAIKLDSRGPILFRQERHGYNNRAISVLKFRSMFASNDDSFVQTTRDDPRVTRVGRWIRRTSIDELPQLINVLRGEMSIVGPRPHATAHNAMFESRIPPFSRRHNVKPGITGWAQVNRCRGETAALEQMKKRVDYDLFYIDNWSFFFDLKIVVLTFFLLLSRDEIVNVY